MGARHLLSFVEGAGVTAIQALLPLLETARPTPQRKNVFEALALIPSDEAMLALFAQSDDRAAVPFMTSSALRWPRRALRLLDANLVSPPELSTLMRSVHQAIAESEAGGSTS